MGMYESPIELYMTDIQTQIIIKQEEQILQAVRNVAVGIDREELVRALKYDRDQYEKGYRDAQPKWIPVTERLPKNGDVVLCYMEFNDVRILQWDDVSAWWLGYGRGDDWQKVNVTHWMPLPEPPKEVE